MIYVFSADAATVTGWSLMACAMDTTLKLLAHGATGEVAGTTGVEVGQTFDALAGALKWLQPKQVVFAYERLFLPTAAEDEDGSTRAKAVGTMTAQLCVGRWVGIAEERGYLVYHYTDGKPGVPPGAWRNARLGKQRWTRKKAKAAALRRVAKVYDLKLEEKRHHTAEAICLGEFVALDIRDKVHKGLAERIRR